jgi:hypothetical protein
MPVQQTKTPATDCAEWALHNALVLGIAVVFGYKSDHTALVRAAAFALPGHSRRNNLAQAVPVGDPDHRHHRRYR